MTSEKDSSSRVYPLVREDFHILDSLPIGCGVLDAKGRLIYCNRALQHCLRLPEKNANIFAISPLFQPNGKKSVDMAREFIEQAFTAGSASFEWTHVTGDGEEKGCSISLVRHHNRTEPLVIACVLFMDQLEALVNIDNDNRDHFGVMLNSSPLCCHYRDINLKLVDCNQKAIELFGYASKEDYLNYFDTREPLYQPDGSLSESRANELRQEALESGYLKFEWVHQHLNGEPIPCEDTMIRIEHAGKTILLAYIRDLRAEKAIQYESDELVRIMLDATPLGCNVMDAELRLLDCNQEALKLFGIPTKDEYFRCFAKLSPKHQPDGSTSEEKSRQMFDLARQSGRLKLEWMHQTVNRELIPCEVTIVSMMRRGELIYTSYIRDLRELRHTMSLLRALEGKVYIDSLTGIHNRRFLFEVGAREFDKARRVKGELSCIVFDIDFFKRVNDTYGHLTGDQVLKHLAQTVTDVIRCGSIFARYGGEEFVILLPDTPKTVAATVAERVRQVVMQKEVVCDNNILGVTISSGVAGMTEDTKDLESLLNAADEAMYRAKASGRNNTRVWGM